MQEQNELKKRRLRVLNVMIALKMNNPQNRSMNIKVYNTHSCRGTKNGLQFNSTLDNVDNSVIYGILD